jgi:hypothetical protein
MVFLPPRFFGAVHERMPFNFTATFDSRLVEVHSNLAPIAFPMYSLSHLRVTKTDEINTRFASYSIILIIEHLSSDSYSKN